MRTPTLLATALLALVATAAAARPAENRTLRDQVLLDRAHFSPGEIDGLPGRTTALALAAFGRERGTGSDTTPGAARRALAADLAPTLVAYTLTEADVAGPFFDVPADMMEKAKLESLGYASAVEALGERFHTSPALLRRLNPRSRFAAGNEIQVPNVGAGATAKAASLRVSAGDQSVSALDAEGQVLARYPATIGGEHDPLPLGEWTIVGVSMDPIYHYNPELFWDADPANEKVKVAAGPNNPVGTVWIDLSKPHYGIHGTPEPSRIGKTSSHGCVRLTNWDVEELAKLVAPRLPTSLQE